MITIFSFGLLLPKIQPLPAVATCLHRRDDIQFALYVPLPWSLTNTSISFYVTIFWRLMGLGSRHVCIIYALALTQNISPNWNLRTCKIFIPLKYILSVLYAQVNLSKTLSTVKYYFNAYKNKYQFFFFF